MSLDQALAHLVITVAGTIPLLILAFVAYIKAKTAAIKSTSLETKMDENTQLTKEGNRAARESALAASTAAATSVRQATAIDEHLHGTEVQLLRTDQTAVNANTKADAAWDFIIKRTQVEAKEKKLVDENGYVIEEVRKVYEALSDELKVIYQTNDGDNLPLRELLMRIEARMGDRLVKEICVPYGIYHGACLWIAAQLAKEINGHGIAGRTP